MGVWIPFSFSICTHVLPVWLGSFSFSQRKQAFFNIHWRLVETRWSTCIATWFVRVWKAVVLMGAA
jgi:predicted component of type VI protein secretion system